MKTKAFTKEDVLKALTWQHWRGSGIIGAARYKCYGRTNKLWKVVIYKNTVIQFKRKNEVESAVASIIANFPVVGKLL